MRTEKIIIKIIIIQGIAGSISDKTKSVDELLVIDIINIQ